MADIAFFLCVFLCIGCGSRLTVGKLLSHSNRSTALCIGPRNRCCRVTWCAIVQYCRHVLAQAFGARLVLTPATKGMGGAVAKAEAIVSDLGENAFMLQQFNNPDNPKVDYSRGERVQLELHIWQHDAELRTRRTLALHIASRLEAEKPACSVPAL